MKIQPKNNIEMEESSATRFYAAELNYYWKLSRSRKIAAREREIIGALSRLRDFSTEMFRWNKVSDKI